MKLKRGKKKRVLVDFDGVITAYSNGWQGYGVCEDIPVPGVLDWLERVYAGYRVTIVSGRAKTWRGRRCIRRWLWKHVGRKRWKETFCHIEVTCRKVDDYVLYVDDRAWPFYGTRFPTLHEIALFEPWHRLRRR